MLTANGECCFKKKESIYGATGLGGGGGGG